MSTKHFLKATFFFVIILLLIFSAKSQENSDTIIIAKKIIGYEYYKDDFLLNSNQLLQITKSNPESYKLMQKSVDMWIAGYIWSSVGGGILGSALGYALGRAILHNPMDKPLFFTLFSIGTAIFVTGIGFEIVSIKKAKAAVAIYNNSIKQKSNPNIDLGISTNGMMFRLNF